MGISGLDWIEIFFFRIRIAKKWNFFIIPKKSPSTKASPAPSSPDLSPLPVHAVPWPRASVTWRWDLWISQRLPNRCVPIGYLIHWATHYYVKILAICLGWNEIHWPNVYPRWKVDGFLQRQGCCPHCLLPHFQHVQGKSNGYPFWIALSSARHQVSEKV